MVGSDLSSRVRKSNRDGIGCRVKVVCGPNLTQFYTVNTAAGYLSASDKRLTIGLGTSRAAKSVEVVWPSGVRQNFVDVSSGTTIRAIEPAVQ